MTHTTSLTLRGASASPDASVICGSGRPFLVLNLGPSVSIILPGHEHEAVGYARDVAQALMLAATLLEQQLETVRRFETDKAGV